MDLLVDMLQTQIDLQQVLQRDPRDIEDPEERIQYIKDMILAATNELHEALNEIGWKPWNDEHHINEVPAFYELRDAWQFIMNAMFAVSRMSPDGLATWLHHAHSSKVRLNLLRKQTGEKQKCPQCRRALDEIELKEVIAGSTNRVDLHCVCGAYVGSRSV